MTWYLVLFSYKKMKCLLKTNQNIRKITHKLSINSSFLDALLSLVSIMSFWFLWIFRYLYLKQDRNTVVRRLFFSVLFQTLLEHTSVFCTFPANLWIMKTAAFIHEDLQESRTRGSLDRASITHVWINLYVIQLQRWTPWIITSLLRF